MLADDKILLTMENFLTNHPVDPDNAEEWKTVREEAVEHLRKDTSNKDRQNWTQALNSNDSRALWTTINWKGSFTSSEEDDKPELDDLAAHFAIKPQNSLLIPPGNLYPRIPAKLYI